MAIEYVKFNVEFKDDVYETPPSFENVRWMFRGHTQTTPYIYSNFREWFYRDEIGAAHVNYISPLVWCFVNEYGSIYEHWVLDEPPYDGHLMTMVSIEYEQHSNSGYYNHGVFNRRTLQSGSAYYYPLPDGLPVRIPIIDPNCPIPIPPSFPDSQSYLSDEFSDYMIETNFVVNCFLPDRIPVFKWTANDESAIRQGQKVSFLTASAYNRYIDTVNKCRTSVGLPAKGYEKIVPGAKITYEAIQNIVYASQEIPSMEYLNPLIDGGMKEYMDSTILSKCKKGMPILASIFSGSEEDVNIKNILNNQIYIYNMPGVRYYIKKKWGL